jgi:hypothetical protein
LQGFHRRESGADVTPYGVALEIPGDVFANVAAGSVLIAVKKLHQELRVTL